MILANHLQRTSVMKDIPRVPLRSQLYCASTHSSEKNDVKTGVKVHRVDDRPGSKFCKTEELMLDACAGTSRIGKTCLQLPKQRRFVSYKKDSLCFQDASSSLLNVYEKHMFSLE